MSALVSKLAVVAAAAVGLYVTTVGLPVTPHSCLRTVGVAAAAPSPTCGADERECLHASVKTGLYGVRYVSPEDVARCVEAFNACIHGTLEGNPNPPASTPTAGGNPRTSAPDTSGIKYELARHPNSPSSTSWSRRWQQDDLAETLWNRQRRWQRQ